MTDPGPSTGRDRSSSEALRRFERAFPGLRIDAVPGVRGLGLDYRSVETDRFTIHGIRSRGRFRAIGPLPLAIAVGQRFAGAVTVTRSGREVDTSRPFLRPTAPAEFEVSEGAVVLIALQPSAMAEYLSRSGGRESAPGGLRAVPRFVALGLAMCHAEGFLLAPEALTPHAAAELQDLLCWSLLQAFADPWAETRSGAARPSVLRRALSYMEEHADGVVAMPEVAGALLPPVVPLSLDALDALDGCSTHA